MRCKVCSVGHTAWCCLGVGRGAAGTQRKGFKLDSQMSAALDRKNPRHNGTGKQIHKGLRKLLDVFQTAGIASKAKHQSCIAPELHCITGFSAVQGSVLILLPQVVNHCTPKGTPPEMVHMAPANNFNRAQLKCVNYPNRGRYVCARR